MCVQAKEYGRRAVSVSGESKQSEEFSRKLVEFLKICENIVTSPNDDDEVDDEVNDDDNDDDDDNYDTVLAETETT